MNWSGRGAPACSCSAARAARCRTRAAAASIRGVGLLAGAPQTVTRMPATTADTTAAAIAVSARRLHELTRWRGGWDGAGTAAVVYPAAGAAAIAATSSARAASSSAGSGSGVSCASSYSRSMSFIGRDLLICCCGAGTGEDLAQLGARSVQPGSHRPHRNAQRPRNLLVGQLLPRDQQQHVPIAGWQRSQRGAQQRAHCLGGDIGCHPLGVTRNGILGDGGLLNPVLTGLVSAMLAD